MIAARQLQPFLRGPETPEIGPGPRVQVQPLAVLNRQLDETLSQAGLAGTRARLVRAIVLLWQDQLEAAHAIAQTIETQDGSYVHAILHRREPDYANARYWFRRVGQHPCFDRLARRAQTLLKAKGNSDLAGKLMPRGEWDAFAFVDACEAAAGRPGNDPEGMVLREIQQVEFEVLLDHLVQQA
ncbi:MAG TPA: hypothetical protein VEO53_06100 [Candidatus Binatia bacterium]|nr:hypothetical protein [Candidatus Binatia bacterium]